MSGRKAEMIVAGEKVKIDMDRSHSTGQGIFTVVAKDSTRFSVDLVKNALEIAEDMNAATIGVKIVDSETPDKSVQRKVLVITFSTDGRGMMIAPNIEDEEDS